MKYAGEVSLFEGVLDAPAAGRYTLRILAAESGNANFAMFTKEIAIGKR